MTTRTMWWGLICCGVVGALLVLRTDGAPEDLPPCEACQEEAQAVFPGDGVNGPALRYQDHGDGTTTDLNTLLMWEQKHTAVGVHYVHNIYTWSSTGTAPDGTAFTVFLDTLNNTCDGNEVTACTRHEECAGIGNGLCGHAGYRDWRMPNIKELQSLVHYGKFNPVIDSTFPGATAAASTWSVTDFAPFPVDAWFVFFGDGLVFDGRKSLPLRVRAVRGGASEQP
jgi:hypothetical protein